MRTRSSKRVPPRPPCGMTLVEILTVMAVMGVLLAMSVPSFHRTVEQAHADVTGANLRAIWGAQRFFWLENRTYATSLAQLEAAQLLEPALTTSPRYRYRIATADDSRFVAEASRTGSGRWSGTFAINESGTLSGFVGDGDARIVPGYQ